LRDYNPGQESLRSQLESGRGQGNKLGRMAICSALAGFNLRSSALHDGKQGKGDGCEMCCSRGLQVRGSRGAFGAQLAWQVAMLKTLLLESWHLCHKLC
jgi:hypothetical protein